MAMCRKKTEKFSVDQMMLNVASSLVRDFQTNFNDVGFCSDYQMILKSGVVADIRKFAPVPNMNSSTAEFKAVYQLQSVMKRYRFRKDIYSDEELIEKAVLSFRETQSRLALLDLDRLPAFSQAVLDRAASYIADTLGVYSDEEHRNLSRFGRKASVGIPARAACEAARWELPISGSREQISWFDSEMSQDCSVQEYWAAQKGSDPSRSTYQETDSLTLTLVPKTFKSLRSIMPNTTIGSYMSFGLGEMIRKRLKRKGYNIATLQERHKFLASRASQDNILTTADLSSASDSISVALVKRLFPPDWFEILTKSRIGGVLLPDSTRIESLTFCTMGVGYTFPLQTLVFLSLLKAVEHVMFRKLHRPISVYGDDLIYPSRMHSQVVYFFQLFGFVMNLDKTFHEGPFRESCGGDYHRGVDVRPFQPRNDSATVSSKAYEAILYKYVNGLLARWSEYEIGKTLQFLVLEIESVVNKVKIVPSDYPDDSGVKCPSLMFWEFLRHANTCKPKHIGHGVYRFSFLRLVSDERREERHGPYLWLALRGHNLSTDSFVDGVVPERSCTVVSCRIDSLCNVQSDGRPLITREDRPIKTFRSKITGRRLRRTSTFVTISHTGRYTRQSGTSGFEDRR